MEKNLISVHPWKDAKNYGYNPYSLCSCCSKNIPTVLIEIGDTHHRAASFQLCDNCKTNLKELL